MSVHFVRHMAMRLLHSGEGGATAVEYGLLVALVAAVIVVSVGTLGQAVIAMFSSVPGF